MKIDRDWWFLIGLVLFVVLWVVAVFLVMWWKGLI